jgi:hypothetical protein
MEEPLEYFAQVGRSLEETNIMGYADRLDKVLTFTGAVCDALFALQFTSRDNMDDETIANLAQLGKELTREAKRRGWALYRARRPTEFRHKNGTDAREEG